MRTLRLACLVLLAAGSARVALAAQPSPPQPQPAALQARGDAALGAQLFSGAVRFSRGGPPCAACHDDAALPRPGGGTMGPDLTNVYGHMGPEGVQAAVQTLFFPTMLPLFSTRPLTPEEQNAIAAYLESTNGRSARGPMATVSLAAFAGGGFVVALIATAFAGRSRIRSVRRAMLARTAAGRRSAT